MVENTTAEIVGTKEQAELWNGLHRGVCPKDCRQVWSGPNSREPPVTDNYGVHCTTGNFEVNPIVVSPWSGPSNPPYPLHVLHPTFVEPYYMTVMLKYFSACQLLSIHVVTCLLHALTYHGPTNHDQNDRLFTTKAELLQGGIQDFRKMGVE